MPKFSQRSLDRLATCDERLQRLFQEVIKYWDCTVLTGHRTKEEQDAAVKARTSKTPWPRSKHNSLPSRAADVAPYPIDWNNRERFIYFAGYVMRTAQELGIKLRWGGDWDNDKNPKNDGWDLPHFELVE